MNELYFLIKYTPFWSIPLFLLFCEVAWISKIRKKRKQLIVCCIGALLSASMTGFYYWAGSPGAATKALRDSIHYLTN